MRSRRNSASTPTPWRVTAALSTKARLTPREAMTELQKQTIVSLALALTITSCQMPLRSSNAEPIASSEIYVIDGDTVRVHDQPPNVRLVGFNAPETWHAACPAEQLQGDKAAGRLRELVRAGKLDFEYVACSCPTGTQGT